jgi:hypothetical protein
MKSLSIVRPLSRGAALCALAIVAAVAGSAIAATDGQRAKRPVTKKKVKKIADKQITKRAPGLSVASAANAANADAVDGHSAECPGGTFLHNGVCFDSAPRFANVNWTSTDCADAGGYTPSISELASIRNEPGVDLGPPGDGTWTDSRFIDAGTNKAMTVVDNGTVESDAVSQFRQLRCAFPLVR